MNTLGISCYYHDAAACLIQDGQVVAAASEERFTRKKQDESFPMNAIRYCLETGGIGVEELDHVGFYERPFVKFDRILRNVIENWPSAAGLFRNSVPSWLQTKLHVRDDVRKQLGYSGPVYFAQHHESHAASSFFASGFDEAAILTVDGVGEWATATMGRGKDRKIELLSEIHFPHSIGLFYSAFTHYLGFKVNSAEYKVMGLAPFGEPKYYDQVRGLIDVKPDASFALDMRYFDYHRGGDITTGKLHKLLGGPPRTPEGPMDQRHMDIAASLQKVTDEVMLTLARRVHEVTGLKKLCMAGGVALNCVANSKILLEGPFEEIFIQPAAGDAGGALGIALLIEHQILGRPRSWRMENAFLGPEFDEAAIRRALDAGGVPCTRLEPEEMAGTVARLIAEQNVVGWFQGRMEFGPRALGSRSILADARRAENRDKVNLKIKFREGFRPFAPSVLEEKAAEYFEIDRPSPYMLLVAQVRPEKRGIPAVTHVDGSARLQTVARAENPLYYDVIREFDRLTGVPAIINTSFNVRGEPIVCTPADAVRCFLRTHMDYLAVGPYLLDKREMGNVKSNLPPGASEFPLD